MEGVNRGDARVVQVSEHASQQLVEIVVSVSAAFGGGEKRSGVSAGASEAVAQLDVADGGRGVDWVMVVKRLDHGKRTMDLAPRIWFGTRRRDESGIPPCAKGVELR